MTSPRTVILSTHLIEESEALFDRVIIIDSGRIRVESDSDHTASLAFTLSGPTATIDRLSTNRKILQSRSVSGLKSVTIEGSADDELSTEARHVGARLAPASLQELVAAFGADIHEMNEIKKGERA